jgi:hypothetical protein
MPAISLVVCVHLQRDLLERLLRESQGCYDDLVVVHDGSDVGGARAMVEAAGGRFFEGPRAFQQEPHLPFAFGQAKHDWILHFDADEFPSDEMKLWLREFRLATDPVADVSGYTCIWPLWNRRRTTSNKWPRGRIFLFDRRKVRLFGMAEQAVVPDGQFRPVDLVLHHQPKRKSYGLHNILVRKQAYHWRRLIAQSLLGKPTDLACWRWESETWPPEWEQIRSRPWRTAIACLIMGTLRCLRDQWRTERKLTLEAAVNAPIHHALICLEYRRLRRSRKNEPDRNN